MRREYVAKKQGVITDIGQEQQDCKIEISLSSPDPNSHERTISVQRGPKNVTLPAMSELTNQIERLQGRVHETMVRL